MEISTEIGLRPEHIEDAAKLYASAFERKFLKLFGPPNVMSVILKQIIHPANAVAAISSSNVLLGVCGFKTAEHSLKLFAALEKFSRDNELKSIRLDVIDENPRAKELYESLGFIPAKHEKISPIIGNLIGVSGVTTMIKQLE